MEFLYAAELKKRYKCYGHFYELVMMSGERVKCRSVLEIVDTAIPQENPSDISEMKPDVVAVMMNPGSSHPRDIYHMDAEIAYPQAGWRARKELVLTQPDNTQYQLMRVAVAKGWRHIRVLNLSDLRDPKSGSFLQKVEGLGEMMGGHTHSIFCRERSAEYSHALLRRDRAPILLGWGQDAGLNVARSTYISGFAGTSNLLAGQRYNIPVSGTMAHSYISAFEHEIDAFRAYAAIFPDHSVFLIDTYDTIEGARQAVRVGLEMKKQGHTLKGVRLDSGDMIDLSCRVRDILDKAGLSEVQIYASSGFDEFKIHELLTKGACIEAFGVGTKVGSCADAPYLDVVYKLVKLNDRLVRKLSPGKKTLAGEKQVFRKVDTQGYFAEDIIGLRDETIDGATPLLSRVMYQGEWVGRPPALEDIQTAFKSNFSALPDKYKSIHERYRYPVNLSEGLVMAQEEI